MIKKFLSPILLALFIITIAFIIAFIFYLGTISNIRKTNIAAKTTEERIAESDIKSIIIKTTPCYGTCPVFRAEFFNDGSACFIGEKYTKLEGKYRGKFSQYTFMKIYDYIKFTAIEKLGKEYLWVEKDAEYTTITICYKNGRTKSIDNGTNLLPVQFEFLETYLRYLINDFVKWEKVDE